MSVNYSRALSLILMGATLMATSMATVGAGSVDERTSGDKLRRANAERRSIVNQILNRWEPLAAQAGGHYAAWREVFASQLDTFDFEVLLRLNDLKLSEDPRASYTRIEQVMRGAQVRAFEVARKAPAFALKFGSTTSDQVFVPITPCRIVDTRSVGGPIAAGTTRNYLFYADKSDNDWSAQGGPPGSASSVCPGTYFSAALTPGPSAAVVTLTVVAPSAAGNWIAWGGAAPKPTISALNWNAGDIAANTTIVPSGNRSGTGPGGGVLDFAVSYNGPSGQAHLVADVVGYMIQNTASQLDCLQTGESLGPVGTRVVAPACPAGYALTGGNCRADDPVFLSYIWFASEYQVGAFPQAAWSCAYVGVQSKSVASSICCRVPGR